MDYITVKLFKVSQESVYLDIIAECLLGYVFNKIEVGIRTYDHYGNALNYTNYDLTNSILADYPNQLTDEIAVRVPLLDFFGSLDAPPSIYSLTLECVESSGFISLIELADFKYFIKVGLDTSDIKVPATTYNLFLHNSELLLKFKSGDIVPLTGTISLLAPDGTVLGTGTDNYQIVVSNQLDINKISGLGFNNSLLVFDKLKKIYIDPSDIEVDNINLNRDFYILQGIKTIFLQGIATISNGADIIGYDSYNNTTTILTGPVDPSSYDYIEINLNDGIGFKSGDVLYFEIETYNSANNTISDPYFTLEKLDNTTVTLLLLYGITAGSIATSSYVLTLNDILNSGCVRLRAKNQKFIFNDIKVTRYAFPDYPTVLITGDLTIPISSTPSITTLTITVHTSDTNSAFYYLMDNILNLENFCTPISDEAIRNYLILYGHLLALENGQQSIAEEYFKILVKNFTKCGNNSRACGGTCGCQSSPCGPPSHHYHPVHNSCNCKS